MCNLKSLGMEKDKHIFVSDKWLGTVAAMKQLRVDEGMTVAQLPHEIVNHSAGEITNSRGFTTNAIEARWSVLKRWARKHLGGKLPGHNDRAKWRMLLIEFQYRQFVLATEGVGRTLEDHSVSVKMFMKHAAAFYKSKVRATIASNAE